MLLQYNKDIKSWKNNSYSLRFIYFYQETYFELILYAIDNILIGRILSSAGTRGIKWNMLLKSTDTSSIILPPTRWSLKEVLTDITLILVRVHRYSDSRQKYQSKNKCHFSWVLNYFYKGNMEKMRFPFKTKFWKPTSKSV